MEEPAPPRRRWLAAASSLLLGLGGEDTLTVFTFGDSVLDCAHYNDKRVHPAGLMVRNHDALFPAFKGRDLLTLHGPQVRLEHRAVDGATVAGLPSQRRGVRPPSGPTLTLLTVGGNDLLGGLAGDRGPGLKAFERSLSSFLRELPLRPVLIGTVYDPTFGDDSRNFLSVPAQVARANHRRVNEVLMELGRRHGRVVDLHAHFLRGDPSWYVDTIEPSLIGASEVRRVFLESVPKELLRAAR